MIACTECGRPAYDVNFDKNDKLDWYSSQKLFWIEYPNAHIDHIKSRTIVGKDENKKIKVKGKEDRMMDVAQQIPI